MIQDIIPSFLHKEIDFEFPIQSRIQLISLTEKLNVRTWIKRDDEIGMGIGGNKYRKMSSLIPFLLKNGFNEVVCIGSFASNFLLGFASEMKKYSISVTCIVKESQSESIQKKMLLSLILKDKIHVIEKDKWNKVEYFAQELIESKRNEGKKAFFIPEGGSCLPSLWGAMTLAADIIQFSEKNEIHFDQIYIDSGTGLTAIATLILLEFWKYKTELNIILVAGTEKEFGLKLLHYLNVVKPILGISGFINTTFNLHFPETSKSFGSFNQTLKNYLLNFSSSNGIWLDPIYNVKLFFTSQNLINQINTNSEVLIIHSGGTLSLQGFQEKIFD